MRAVGGPEVRQQAMYRVSWETPWSEPISAKVEAIPGQENLGTTGGLGFPPFPIRLTTGVSEVLGIPQKWRYRDLSSSPLPLKGDLL